MTCGAAVEILEWIEISSHDSKISTAAPHVILRSVQTRNYKHSSRFVLCLIPSVAPIQFMVTQLTIAPVPVKLFYERLHRTPFANSTLRNYKHISRFVLRVVFDIVNCTPIIYGYSTDPGATVRLPLCQKSMYDRFENESHESINNWLYIRTNISPENGLYFMG